MDRIVVAVDEGASGSAAARWALTEEVDHRMALTVVCACSPTVTATDVAGAQESDEDDTSASAVLGSAKSRCAQVVRCPVLGVRSC